MSQKTVNENEDEAIEEQSADQFACERPSKSPVNMTQQQKSVVKISNMSTPNRKDQYATVSAFHNSLSNVIYSPAKQGRRIWKDINVQE